MDYINMISAQRMYGKWSYHLFNFISITYTQPIKGAYFMKVNKNK